MRQVDAAFLIWQVLNAAINVLAPLYGGMLISAVGVPNQPLVATCHYLMLLPLTLLAVPPIRANKAKAQKED